MRRHRIAAVLALAFALVLLAGCEVAAGPSAAAREAGEEAEVTATGPTGPTAAWDRVLATHVVDGGVDYAALKRDRAGLDAYLSHLRKTDPAALPRDERLAFWINAYNAVVVHFVLQRYPGIESVRKVEGFFDELTFEVGGRELTLDQIESESRGMDPRAHFAVVCASTSCPDLRGEAYVGPRIDAQLEEQTESFLADEEKGLRYDAEDNELYLSSIFKWYAGDFTGGSTVVAFFARGGVRDWVVEHLGDRELARAIEDREPSVQYLEYDWSLNDL